MFTALARNVPRRVLRPTGSRALAQLPNSNLPSLDFSPEPEQTTGAKSSKDSLSSVEQKRRRIGRISLAVLVLGFGINVAYMGREWDEFELKAKKLVRLLSFLSVWF
jgi:import inner membrane translocase subunit TIM50